MTDRLSPEREAEIAARAEAATPGPWEEHPKYGSHFFAYLGGSYLRGVGTLNFGEGDGADADRALTVNAQTDITALLAELAAVRAERDQAHDDMIGANLARWEEEQDNARLRLALKSAQRGRRQMRARVAELEAELAKYVGQEPTIAEEMAYLSRCLDAVHEVCDDAEKQATRWENPLPVPEWVARVRAAADGLEPRRSYPPALPWAQLMDDEDLHEFLNDIASAAVRRWQWQPDEVPDREVLRFVEEACSTWRAIAEAQHAHNTAPGPDAEDGAAQ
ncbi:hypothetical protein [Streptomyces sp. NPDC057413]|uniref:hypothetical protein n=1 Tax=Streptomyces sp. NPDC057413 TaxID=3346124 RepID=UPI0036A32464